MTALRSATAPLRQYATFRGRAGRPEYWWFVLLAVAALFVTSGLDALVLGTPPADYGPLTTLSTLVLLVPFLAVSWRRLHDTGRTGAWTLLLLIPVLGWIAHLVLVTRPSTRSSRRREQSTR